MLTEWVIWISSVVGSFVILTVLIVSVYYVVNIYMRRRETQSGQLSRRPWVDLELEKYSIVRTHNSLSLITTSEHSQERRANEVAPLSPTGELFEIPLTPLYPSVSTTVPALPVQNTKTTATTPKLRKLSLIPKKYNNPRVEGAENGNENENENENEKLKVCVQKESDGAYVESTNESRPLTLQEKAKTMQKHYTKVLKQAWGKVKPCNYSRYSFSNSSSFLP
eukprot:TRINITY_DN4115_c0_g1_i1.p1 TRINITY_DN4115_c0_g1~~TRINITY_DN4115_c0_g1_i1.p1  ORF type:complete len:223 (+),score=40.61 TRINITY_DN4115_c0_g1_i1:307-975(+)